jgi:uncharacterized protein (TIGR03083 family)
MTAADVPVQTSHLFGELDAALIALLKSLGEDEWRLATIVPRWNVQQVAAHLVDTAFRRLSLGRDSRRPPAPPPRSDRELADLVNTMNAAGVRVYASLSPQVLIGLTESVTPQLAAYLKSLDPMATATFGVSWAGESASRNWFDIAREYTERWHHQQQIRLATNRPGIMTPRLYVPVLETFMRSLPHTFRAVDAPRGAAFDAMVPGPCGGRWRIRRVDDRWRMETAGDPPADATAIVPDDLAWRLFTKGASREEARARVEILGDERLASVIFSALAIVA